MYCCSLGDHHDFPDYDPIKEFFNRLEKELNENFYIIQKQELIIKLLLECIKQTENPNLNPLVTKLFCSDNEERIIVKSLYEDLVNTNGED